MAEGGLPNAGTGGGGYVQGMDTEVDLTTVDRDVLIAIIAELQAVIERLQRRIAELEGQAKPGDPLRMPGAKSARKPPAQQGPRKQRRHGFARPRMTPTHRVEHVMENCPDCGAHLSGGWTHRTREVRAAGGSGASHRAHLHCSDLPGVPTALHTSGGTGQRGQRLGVNLLRIATLRESPSAASSGIWKPCISCASAWGPS